MSGNITITSGGTTIGLLSSSGTQADFSTALYKYANLTLPYNPNDPGLQYTYDNSSLASSVLLYASFFNLLNEPSLPLGAAVGTNILGLGASGGFLSTCLDVRLFGAIGDAVTDDTAAVQRALDQAYANYLAKIARGFANTNTTLSITGNTVSTTSAVGVSGNPLGSTIVCIPSGVYCLVYPRLLDNSDPVGFGAWCSNPVAGQYTREGVTALWIDDGVTLLIDGGLILGWDETLLKQLNANTTLFGQIGLNFPLPVVALTNRQAFIGNAGTVTTDLFNSQTCAALGDGTTTLFYVDPANPTCSILQNTIVALADGVPVPYTLTPNCSILCNTTSDCFFCLTLDSPPINGAVMTVQYSFAEGPSPLPQPGPMTYLESIAQLELGPRNTGIRVTGEGFIECGFGRANALPTLEMTTAAHRYFQVHGIRFCKCDQSFVDGITFQGFGNEGPGIYWGHSEKIEIHDCLFQHIGWPLGACGDDCSGQFIIGTTPAILVEMLRGSKVYNNRGIDVEEFIFEFCNFHTDIHNNFAEQNGTSCPGVHLFVDATTLMSWCFSDPFNSDGNRQENHYSSNRGTAWRPNEPIDAGNEAFVPVRYLVGDHIYIPVFCSPAGTPSSGLSGIGQTGPTEPNWESTISHSGNTYVLDSVVNMKGVFGRIVPPLYIFSGDVPLLGEGTYALSPTAADLVVYRNGVPLVRNTQYTWARSGGSDTIKIVRAFWDTSAVGDIFTYDLQTQIAWWDQGAPVCGNESHSAGSSYGEIMEFIGNSGGNGDVSGIRIIANQVSDNYGDGIVYAGLTHGQIAHNQVLRNFGFGIADLDADILCFWSGALYPSDHMNIVDNYVSGNLCSPQIYVDASTATVNNPETDSSTNIRGGTAQPFTVQVTGEVPSGAIPGTTFTLAQTPLAGTLSVYVNGLVADPSEYTLVGTTITFGTALSSGSTITANYSWQTASTSSSSAPQNFNESGGGNQVGSNIVSVSTNYPPIPGTIRLWLNDNYFSPLVEGTDYTVSGTTITFTPPIPVSTCTVSPCIQWQYQY